jgi:hypothetical protein
MQNKIIKPTFSDKNLDGNCFSFGPPIKLAFTNTKFLSTDNISIMISDCGLN